MLVSKCVAAAEAAAAARARARARKRKALSASLARKRLVRRAQLERRKCLLVLLRPGQIKARRHRHEPLVEKKWWPELPHWISLHHARGPRRKCWEGHCLRPDLHDGRRYSWCSRCYSTPKAGTAILACHECRWSLCTECTGGHRLPLLRDDPLFHGPSAPGLLQAVHGRDAPRRRRGAVIVVPGGNYEFLCANEGLPVARWLAAQGVTAYVLRYRLLPRHTYRDALSDLQTAVSLVRRRHRGLVAAIGFSAGGHLVASHAVAARKMGRRQLDAQVLVYPAIDCSDWGHPRRHGFWDWETCLAQADGLLENGPALMGKRGFAAPPTFLVASTGDSVCPARLNGDVYAAALKRRRVPHRYVRGSLGEHGFGLSGEWVESCGEWLESRGFGFGCSKA